MTLRLVTPPSALPLTLDVLKAHLNIEDSETQYDALVMGYLRAAVQHIDGRDGWLGRALCTQTWDLLLDRFPCGLGADDRFYTWSASGRPIRIPLPPLQSVTSITYVDDAGATQTLAADLYQVSGAGGFGDARIVPAYGRTWPTTRCQPDAVAVRFVAGYLNNDSPADTANGVPENVKLALMLIVGDWYNSREDVIIGSVSGKMPRGADALLEPLRVNGAG